MANYTVTVFDLAPGLVVMRYQPTVVPVDISLADLPSEPMELDHVHLYASVSNPSALTYVDLSIRVGAVYNALVGADGLSPASGAWQMMMSPGAPANITGKYMTLPLPRLLLSRSVTLTLRMSGTLGTDYVNLTLDFTYRHSSPRRVDDLITRTTYRDADGYIIS